MIRGKVYRTLLVTASLALAGGCSSLPSGGGTQLRADNLRVATWNLEHLAERDGQGCRPRTEADYAELRRHADALPADVVALQEVENEAAAARVFPADKWSIVMSDRPDTARSGFCRGSSGPRILKQDVGFAIRKGVPFRRNPDVRELGLGNPDLRWGVDVTILSKRPVRLLSVHLKSGCNIGRDAADKDCEVLFRQAPALESWIDSRALSGEHFAILGDWNRRTAMAGDQFLSIVSDQDPPQGALVFTNAGLGATCQARYRDFIDHIAVGIAAAPRVVAGSFREYRYDGDENRYPSDHCPSVVELSS